MSRAIKFGSHLKEIRVHLCQKGQASKGARDFIEKNYVNLKKSNPQTPILVRECSGIQPRLWARYGMGRESSVAITNLSEGDIMKQLEMLSQK